MSVYSGFCTRALENEYNNCILQLIGILAKRCAIALSTQHLNEDTRFAGVFGKLYGQIKKLEEYKYATPKFSLAVSELSEQIGITNYLQTNLIKVRRKQCSAHQNQTTINQPNHNTPSKPKTLSVHYVRNRIKTEDSIYNKAIEKSLRHRELEFLCQFDNN